MTVDDLLPADRVICGLRTAGKAALLDDLARRAALALGREAAPLLPLRNEFHRMAALMVLKAPDIPSVLVETAFISNPQEERLLRDPKHQERFAKSIIAGIRGYFDHYRPQMPVVQSADSSLIMRDLP